MFPDVTYCVVIQGLTVLSCPEVYLFIEIFGLLVGLVFCEYGVGGCVEEVFEAPLDVLFCIHPDWAKTFICG